MSAVDLLDPILTGGLQRNNFFNGRLLSAEDLSAEQRANRIQQARLGRAIGDGVAWGLDVAVLSTQPPAVTVGSGLAINRLGAALVLSNDANVTLVPSTTPVDAGTGVFSVCEPPRPAAPSGGKGAFVLVIAPASGYSGTALVSDQNLTAAGQGACGARFSVEGVRFRLMPISLGDLTGLPQSLRSATEALLPPPTGDVGKREQLRNLLAHLCFGTSALDTFYNNPTQQIAGLDQGTGWGVFDSMRAHGDLTDCDVPLAVIVLTSAGISFVDGWSARRRLIDANAIDAWRPVAGPRRVAESEAAFLQFQAQLATIQKAAPDATKVAAGDYLRLLPAAGWLPGAVGGFDWTVFLQQHAPPSATPVDVSLLRGIIERSWLDEPFAVAQDPPVPLRVYRVPGSSFVVFARSHRGDIRVKLSVSPPDVQVVARSETNATARVAASNTNTVSVVELEPGSYSVEVGATGYQLSQTADVHVVGGRTVDISAALSPTPNGSILVDPVDRATGQRLTKVTRITASNGTSEDGVVQSDGRWLISDLPAATYVLTGIADGYNTATVTSAATAPGTQVNATLIFDAKTSTVPPKPDKCIIVDHITIAPLDSVKLCMVLSGAEFDEGYFYRNVQKSGSAGGTLYERYRIGNRYANTKAKQSSRYTAPTGERLYTTPPWQDMQQLTPEPAQVTTWLDAWREWLAYDLHDAALRNVTPHIYIDPNYTPPDNAKQVRWSPPAYAVFGAVAVPLSIELLSKMTALAVPVEEAGIVGVPPWVIVELNAADIVTINDLGWSWQELVYDATGGVVDPAYLIADAQTSIATIVSNKSYYQGMTSQVQQTLKDNGINDDVALANEDVATLGALLGNEGLASRLISQARLIVSRDSWSLDALGLSDSTKEALGARGIDSMGGVERAAGTDQGKATLIDALGLGTEPRETQNAAINSLSNDAVTLTTEGSIASISETPALGLKGVDSRMARKFAAAGLLNASDLARADVSTIAAAGNISTEAAQAIKTEATEASRANMDLTALAPVTSADTAKLSGLFAGGKVTVGGVLSKTSGEIAGALGDAGRANAILNGIKAGFGAAVR